MKPSADLLADLLDCPETVHVEIGGKERPFLLSVYACELAAAQGHDPLPPLAAAIGDLFGGEAAAVDVDALKADPSAAAARLAGSLPRLSTQTLSAIATVVWAGFLPFGYERSLEAFKATTSPVVLGRVLMSVLSPVLALVRVGKTEDEAPEEGEPGKPEPAAT